jgi:hypothetical protein
VTVTLVSTVRRLAVFVLSHAAYCAALGRCSCTRRRDGKLLAASLTVPARARLPDLPEAVLAVPAIALAIRQGALRVEHSPIPEPVAESVSEVLTEGGPRGAPTTPVEVPDERRAPLVQSRRR